MPLFQLFSRKYSINIMIYFPIVGLMTILILHSVFSIKATAGELSYAGQASKDVSVVGGSRAGATGGSVSLYTGQHAEVFPLLSLPTHGMGGIEISLGYSGNVGQAAKEENRKMQASWVGLGFNLGFEYIFCDHKASVILEDDEYFYSGASGDMFKLLPSETENDIYYPSNGSLWRIERHTAIIGSYSYLIGWTVIKENGIRFIYGDNSTNFDNRNATWFQLHWGNQLIIAADAGDLPYPFRWDLARVEKGQNKWVTYEYEQINEKLTVIAPDSNLTHNFYTQASYPKKVESSNGYAVDFTVEDRDDYHDYYGPEQYEYCVTKRLASLTTSYNDNVTSHIKLGYDYLNGTSGQEYKKLVLTSITTYDSTETQSIPPVTFDYYIDDSEPFFGSIKEIKYSEGGKKEVVYNEIEADGSLLSLNTNWEVDHIERSRWAFSPSALITKYKLDGQTTWHYEIGSFNGYWRKYVLDDLTDSNGDSSITAGDNWVALYNHDMAKFIVLYNNGNQWTRDTIDQDWDGGITNNVRLYAGNDFFIALETQSYTPNERVRRAYFYKKINNVWVKHLMFDRISYNDKLAEVILGLDQYAVQIQSGTNDNNYMLYFGKYDHLSNMLLDDASQEWIGGMIFDVGLNTVVYGSAYPEEFYRDCYPPTGHSLERTLILSLFNGTSWIDTPLSSSKGLRSVAALENGIIFTEGVYKLDGTYCQTADTIELGELHYQIRNGDNTWTVGSFPIGFNPDKLVTQPLAASGMSFLLNRDRVGLSVKQNDVMLFEWNGVEWDSTQIFSHNFANEFLMELTDETCFLYHHPVVIETTWYPNGSLYLSKKIAVNNWTQVQNVQDNIWRKYLHGDPPVQVITYGSANIQLAGNLVVACGGDDDGLDINMKRLAFWWNDKTNTWEVIDVKPHTYNSTLDYFAQPVVFNGRFFIKDFGTNPNYIDKGFACFQRYAGTFIGVPQMPVVKKVKTFSEGDATNNPIVVEYSYDGGILDPAGNTPRFSKATISTPYYEGIDNGPDGYSISYYYNDMDDDDFPDPHGDGSLVLPDLESSITFGESNGGYVLDGQVYYTYDSSASATPPLLPHDAKWYYYSLEEFSDHPDASSRVLLDSVKSLVEGVDGTISYAYDDKGRLIETRTPLFDNKIQIDGISYESFDPTINVFDKVDLTSTKIDSLGTIEYVKFTNDNWRVWNGEVFPAWFSIYANPPSSVGHIETYIEFYNNPSQSRDIYGNLLNWMGPSFDTSGAKYSPDGTKQIATIAHGYTNNVLLFNAEYDFDQNNKGYDGWENKVPAQNSLTISESFTGYQSLEIVDDPASSFGNAGIERYIYPDSVLRNTYILSFWAKSNGPVKGAIGIQHTGGARAVYTDVHPGDDLWHKLECTIDLTSSERTDLQYILADIGLLDMVGGIAYIDDVRFHPVDAIINTKTFEKTTGLVSSVAGQSNIPVFNEYDHFYRIKNVRDFKQRLLTAKEYYYADPYDPNVPNFVKTTNYKSISDYTETINYYDGVGKLLQSRTKIEYDGEEKILVSGITKKNARGQTEIGYKSYIDLITPNDLSDYTPLVSVEVEANTFYNGVNNIDLDDIPYYENKFSEDVKSRLIETAKPSATFSMSSGNTYIKDRMTYINEPVAETLFVGTVVDPDNIISATKAHPRGKFKSKVSYLTRADQTLDSIMVTTYNDFLGQSASTYIDTGGVANTDSMLLRASWSNDLGQADSTYQIDYQKVRMKYDESGRLRFIHNNKLGAENEFIYFKYDDQGRKTEEGIVGPAGTYFWDEETNWAYDDDFPNATHNPTIKYRWYYDYYYKNVDTTIIAPGKLVRVESGDGAYYKEYYYFPESYYDITLVKLPIQGQSSVKGIKHLYNMDGSLNKLIVYPKWSSQSNVRSYEYNYDIAGRLKSIDDGFRMPSAPLKYVEYDYNPDGSVKKKAFGIFENDFLQIFDTTQVYEFGYDGRGMLTSINDPTDVVAGYSGGGNANPHFGMTLEYIDAGQGYYNGRVSKMRSSNSGSSSIVDHDYNYEYNELGWLTKADNINDDTNDRDYVYNRLGNRTAFIENGNTTYYNYYQYSAGSSRLINTTGMTEDYEYDAVGNMIADESHDVYAIDYDYRDLIVFSEFKGAQAFLYKDSLFMTYDETGQRIGKKYRYKYWEYCGPPEEPEDPIGGGEEEMLLFGDSLGFGGMAAAAPPPGQSCLYTGNEYMYYLYDGGQLLATFDIGDEVVEMFVNGPDGLIATYEEDDDAELHYYLSDQVGSQRVVMHAPADGTTAHVTEFTNYHPFGEVLQRVGSFNSPFKFTGKEFDDYSVFEYSYYGARYYNPKLGQFTSVDHAGQFASAYVYCGNNPISVIDPDGNVAAIIPAAISITQQTMALYGYWQMYRSIQMTIENQISGRGSIDFGELLRNFAESYVLGKIGGWKGSGIRIAYYKNKYGTWDTGEIINFGLQVATAGVNEYDKWKQNKEKWGNGLEYSDAVNEKADKIFNETDNKRNSLNGREVLVAVGVDKGNGEMTTYYEDIAPVENPDQTKLINQPPPGVEGEISIHTHEGTAHGATDIIVVADGQSNNASFVIVDNKTRYSVNLIDKESAKSFAGQIDVEKFKSDYRTAVKQGFSELEASEIAVQRLIKKRGSGMGFYKGTLKKGKWKWKQLAIDKNLKK